MAEVHFKRKQYCGMLSGSAVRSALMSSGSHGNSLPFHEISLPPKDHIVIRAFAMYYCTSREGQRSALNSLVSPV